MKEWLINKLLGFKSYEPLPGDEKRVWPKVEYVGDMNSALAKSEELSGKGIENKIIGVGSEWVVATKGGK